MRWRSSRRRVTRLRTRSAVQTSTGAGAGRGGAGDLGARWSSSGIRSLHRRPRPPEGAERVEQRGHSERLFQVVGGALAARLGADRGAAEGGDDDDGKRGIPVAERGGGNTPRAPRAIGRA